jgi:hypothetical protein
MIIVLNILALVALVAALIRVVRRRRLVPAGSLLIPRQVYWALLLLTVLGLVLMATTPEATISVLPAFDAVGLDIATILVALELRRYLDAAIRLTAFPMLRALHRRLIYRTLHIMAMGPLLRCYAISGVLAAVWVLILVRVTLEYFAHINP